MLDRLSSLSLRAPRLVAVVWGLVFVVGLVAAGGLFSSLDADLDGPPSFESEGVSAWLDALDPGGGEVVAVVDGAEPDPDVVAEQQATRGVEEVVTVPSDDGRATAVVVALASGLGDDAHDDLVETVAGTLRSIDAPAVLVGGDWR